jgi:ABC-type transport system involved in cytochrome c biogenesis permease subunit
VNRAASPTPFFRVPALWGFLGALTAAVVWALLAPPERTMGDAIRIVYLHVSATMAGLTCLYGVGVLGLATSFLPAPRVERALRPLWIAGMAAFVAGFLLSLVSARVSWGGVFWAEPRVRASLGVLAVGLVALAVDAGLSPRRARRLAWAAAAALAFLALRIAPLYMHPDHPVKEDTPPGIRAAFLGISACWFVAALFLARLLPDGETRGG